MNRRLATVAAIALAACSFGVASTPALALDPTCRALIENRSHPVTQAEQDAIRACRAP